MTRYGLLTTSFPRFAGDPAGGFVEGMAAGLARWGHGVDVVCADGTTATNYAPPGVRVWRTRYGWPRPSQRLFFRGGAPDTLTRHPWSWGLAALFAAQLARAVRRRIGGWQVLVSHWLVPSALVAAQLARRGRPGALRRHVAIGHGSDVALLTRRPWLARRVIEGLLSPAAHLTEVVFVGSALRDQLVDVLPPPLARRLGAASRVEPMGVTAPGTHRRPPAVEAGRPPLALVLARLIPLKGVDVAVEAMARLEGWRLRIAGEGPERWALERRCAALGLGVRVELVGEVRGGAKWRCLGEADVLVVPSRTDARGRGDSTPTVVAEAWSVGVPVVASDHGGLPELVQRFGPGAAVLVPPGCAQSLANALTQVATPSVRAGLIHAGYGAARSLQWSAVLPRLFCELQPTGGTP